MSKLMAESLRELTPEDRWEISDLLARCAFAADTRDMTLLDEVFVPEASGDFGPAGQPQGRDAIKALFLQLLRAYDATQHLMTTSLVTATPAGAHARTYFVSECLLGGDVVAMGGTDEDDLVRRDGNWRLTYRTILMTWVGGEPAALGPGQ
jgi:SnoaL-like domain